MYPEMWSRAKVWFLPGMPHLGENDEGKLRSKEHREQLSHSQAEQAQISIVSMSLTSYSDSQGSPPEAAFC